MKKFEEELNALLKKHKVVNLSDSKPKCPGGGEPTEIIVNGKKKYVCL